MAQRIYKGSTASQLALLIASLGGVVVGSVVMMPVAIAQETPTKGETTIPGASQLLSPSATSTPPSSSRTGAPSRPTTTAVPEQFAPEASSAVRDAAPNIDLSTVNPEFSVPSDSPQPSASESAQSYGSSYIDTTDYSLGATPLPSVVLSERSTGCSAVIRQGQAVPGSICGLRGQGATAQRSAYGSAPDAFRVGPLSIGPNGIRVTRSLNINDYYNRTERPGAFAGNGNSTLMFPLSVPAVVTSPFGWRIHPIFGNARMHTGTDLGAPFGTPVIAAYSGRVTVSDFVGGYGLTVVLRHDEQTAETLYGHLSEIFVQPGDYIEQGEVIGRVGSTGNSTGPHLHFELRKPSANGWVAVNTSPLLQGAIAQVRQGFQLASALEAEIEAKQLALDIPDYLTSGKNAVKVSADSTDTAVEANADSAQGLSKRSPLTPSR